MRAKQLTRGGWFHASADDHCGHVDHRRLEPPVGAQGCSVVMDCGASSTAQLRTTLYFGLARPKGAVTELKWQLFLRNEVTRRFPDGLTVWGAEGQWRTPAGNIDQEQSKILLLVHPDTAAARQSVLAVIETYGKTFEQESVWESARDVWRGLVPEICRPFSSNPWSGESHLGEGAVGSWACPP